MYSSQAFLFGAILIGLLELVLWKGMRPDSFDQTFDPVQREQLEIEPRVIDLGNLAINEVRAVRVSVTNRKDRVVKLRQPKSTCGCIRFELNQPIDLKPGETAHLSMNYKAPSYPGQVAKDVLLQVENAESAWRIPLKGQVVAASWASPAAFDVVIDEPKQGVVHFTSGEEICDVIVSNPEKIKVTLGTPARYAQSYKIEVRAESGGEGYIAFLSSTADCLATVPVQWSPPSLIDCSPTLVILAPDASSLEDKTEIVVFRESASSTDLAFEPQVDWVRVEEKKTMSDRVLNVSIVADRRRSPHSFSGEIVRIIEKKSGQTVSIRGRI